MYALARTCILLALALLDICQRSVSVFDHRGEGGKAGLVHGPWWEAGGKAGLLRGINHHGMEEMASRTGVQNSSTYTYTSGVRYSINLHAAIRVRVQKGVRTVQYSRACARKGTVAYCTRTAQVNLLYVGAEMARLRVAVNVRLHSIIVIIYYYLGDLSTCTVQ